MNGTELGTQFDFSYAPGVTEEQILGFEMAGQIWSQHLADNVTVNIYVEMTDQLPENVIGGALPGMKKDIKYEKLWEKMSEDITTLNDLTAFNNLVSLDKEFAAYANGKKMNKVGKMKLTNANAKALDFLDGDRDKLDGYILISDLTGQSSVRWDYDPLRSDELANNSLDFLSVAMHEVGHVLGFVSGVDDGDWLNVVTKARNDGKELKDDAMKFAAPLDLFRYSDEGKIDLSMGEDVYFSIDGGKNSLGKFSTGEYSDLGGDGYQASHWKRSENNPLGIMDPALKMGQRRKISTLDTTAMDVMGWDVANLSQLDWQEIYDDALENAEEAFISDRTKDVEKMIKESETYHGRNGSRGRRGARHQLGLWQHIKFQTLDVSVDVPSPFVDEAFIFVDNVTTQMQVSIDRHNNDENLSSNVNESLKSTGTSDLVSVQLDIPETSTEEVESLDLAELGSLISKTIEDFASLNDDLVMPVG